jgi:hypothetical protein
MVGKMLFKVLASENRGLQQPALLEVKTKNAGS